MSLGKVMKQRSSSSAAKPSARKGLGRGGGGDSDVTEDDLLEAIPGGMAAAFVKARLREKTLEVAGLALPPDWTGDMPVVPDDIATTDHDELSNILAQLVNAQSTALSYATKSHIEVGFFEDIEEYLLNVALVNAEGSNDTQRKANAKIAPAVVAAHTLWRAANSEYIEFRDLASQLDKKWKTVSRIGGFVGDDSEGQSAGLSKSSSRGRGAGSSKGSGAGGTAKKLAKRRR